MVVRLALMTHGQYRHDIVGIDLEKRHIPNPTHKRSSLYALTKKGQTTYDTLVDRWNTHVQQMASKFSVSDLDAAIRVLSVMSQVHAEEPST